MSHNDLHFSANQVKVLRWTPVLPALLSILGSLVITQRIVRSHTLLSKTYERLILGLSLVDALSSVRTIIFPLFFRPFYEPSIGCTMDGFFITLSFAGPLYNAVLSLYYVLVIVYNVPDQRIAQTYEPAFHATAIGYGVGGATLGLLLNVYNPEKDDIACWALEWPHGCGDDSLPCERGAWAALFSYSIGLVPLVGVLLVLIISNALIYCTVRKIAAKTEKYAIPPTSSMQLASVATSSVEDVEQPTPAGSTEMSCSLRFWTKDDKASRPTPQAVSTTTAVAAQSISYVLAYFLSLIWPMVMFIVEFVDPIGVERGDYFVLKVLLAIFYPAQGIFNAFVYVRPMVARMRRQDMNRSFWECTRRVLLDAPE